VIDATRKNTVAIDPATGLPYFFVFVNNTSSSNGTYESPYPNLILAQNNSSPNDIIYVFPGNGTTTGMDSGITLQANQKFWGSGVSHSIQTSVGTISIPAQSSSSPTITNTNIDTELNAITLAANNAISGFTIIAPMNDAIFGVDSQSLEVSSCKFENTTTFTIEASFSGNSSISLTDNQFLNNANGIFLTLNGTSTLVCSDNTFEGQTSVSEAPLEIVATSNSFVAHIENNVFNDNITGSIRFNLTDVIDANIAVLNNTITNNGTGSESSSGSSLVIISSGTINNCSIALGGNTFSENTLSSLYMETTGEITTLAITASTNTLSNNGGGGLILATPVNTSLTLVATDNTISGGGDNGIALISSTLTSMGNITINNNNITNIGNSSNGIAINQDFSTLNLTLLNNEISSCEGTGILSYAPTGITSLTLNVSDNTISNCQNTMAGNAASGISIDNYVSLASTMANNTFSDNLSPSVAIGFFTPGNPTVCLTLTDNSSNTDPSYSLTNPGSGAFNLSPCNVDEVNTGAFDRSGTITPVQSCPEGTMCP
jgi:hypothetical protein